MRSALLGAKQIHLTPTEFELLRVLVENAGCFVGHRELLRTVWGPEAVAETQYLRVYMMQLRFKLEPEPTQPRYLLTTVGVAYLLTADA